MRRALLGVLTIIIFAPFTAQAQDIVQEPMCFRVKNEAPYMVYGTIGTDYFTRPDGIKARHRSNFRLEAPGTKDADGYPADEVEFCSYGPFFPDRKLEFVLKTLIPIFSCNTKIDQGPIIVKGRKKEEGGAETWAECFE